MPSDRKPARRFSAADWSFFVLGLVLFVAGVAGVVIGGGTRGAAGAGVVLAGIAGMVWLLGWLSHLNVDSKQDRVREDEAREYFVRHGHWPGEGGP